MNDSNNSVKWQYLTLELIPQCQVYHYMNNVFCYLI
jgi:hypothetical protein